MAIRNTNFPLNFVEQSHQRVTLFFRWAHNDTAWSTMVVTLSVSTQMYLSHPREQYPEQPSNTDS